MKWEKLHNPTKAEWNEVLADFKRRNGFSYERKPRYLADENLGEGSVQLLLDLKCNVKGVWEMGLVGHPDENVWRAAQKDRRILLTHDDDFLDHNRFPLVRSYGVVVLPHKSGEEWPLVQKLVHLKAVMDGGSGFIYEQRIVISENDEWRIIQLGDTGEIKEAIYLMADRNHVFLLKDDLHH